MKKGWYIRVADLAKLKARVIRLQAEMPLGVARGLDDTMDDYVKIANMTLKERLMGNSIPSELRYMSGTIRSPESVPHIPINKGWQKTWGNISKSIVESHIQNLSQHVDVVEFGSGPIYPKYGRYLKIKFDDGNWRTVDFVKPQLGMGFARQSVENVKEPMMQNMVKRAKSVINMVTAGVK